MRPFYHYLSRVLFVILLLLSCSKSRYVPTTKPVDYGDEKILVGKITYEDILYYFPKWQAADRAVQVDERVVNGLRKIDRPLKIICFLGTWCPDSRDGVPPFIHAVRQAKNPNLEVVLIGLDRQKDDPEHLGFQYEIQRVPTFVVFSEGEEIGRMVEIPIKTFAEDLLDMLNIEY